VEQEKEKDKEEDTKRFLKKKNKGRIFTQSR